MINQIVILLVLSTLCPPCLLTPLPLGEKVSSKANANSEVTDDVKELESLRTTVMNKANNTEMTNQETSAIRETLEPLPTPLSLNEIPQANSRSAIFRHRGIKEAKKSYWEEKMPQPNNAYKFVGIQYSPTDLAIYVFNTGDEEGVAVAVEELVREGMMGRTDAINYLQDVKQILAFLRDQCNHQKSADDFKNRAYPKPEITQRFPNPPREQFISTMDMKKREPKAVPSTSAATTEHPHESVIASTSEPKGPVHSASTTIRPKPSLSDGESYELDKEKYSDPKIVDYRSIDMKRRIPPQNLDTYALQIVYKLAKSMFVRSILRGDASAEDILSGIVGYLELEVGNNKISPEVKEKVLEAVSAALVDSLREYQNYIPDPMFDESGLYMHQSMPGKDDPGPKVPMTGFLRELALNGHSDILPLSMKNNRPKSS